MPDITQLPILQIATNETYLISVDHGIAKRVPLNGIGQITGPIGYAGSIGSTGYTGSVSTVPGYVGSKGYIGSTGYVGSSGAYAAIGFTGSRGYVGSIGPSTLLNAHSTSSIAVEYIVGVMLPDTDQRPMVSVNKPVVFVPSTGNVGIGTSQPRGTLNLKNAETPELYFEQGNTPTLHKLYSKGNNFYLDLDTGNSFGGSNFYIAQAGTNKIVVNPQGLLGVNTNNPVTALDVAGNIRFTNAATLPGLDEGYGTLYQYEGGNNNPSLQPNDLIYETQRWAGDGINGPLHAGTEIVGTINPGQTAGVMDFYLTTNVTTVPNQTWEHVLELRIDQAEFYQNVRIDSDLEVDGGDIVTLNSSFNLLNTTATTVNAFGVAEVLNIGTSVATGRGIATFGHHSLVGTNATQYLFDTIASTMYAFGNASVLQMGGASGVATIRNPTLVGVNSEQWIYDTVATTVHFANSASTLTIATTPVAPSSVTIGNSAGTVYIPGSLEVKGAVTYLETTNTAIKDSLIEIHTTFDGAGNPIPTPTDDGADIGLRLHYNNGTPQNAALVMAHDTRFLEWYQSGAESVGLPDVFAGTYGTFKTGSAILVDPTGTYSTNTGALTVVGGVGMGGGLFVGAITTLTGNVYTSGEISIANANAHGGAGYAGMLTLTNTGATNGNKFVRIDAVGTLEIVNSGYSATLLALTNSGNLILPNNIPSTSATTGTLVVTGGVGIGGDTHITGAVYSSNVYDSNLTSGRVTYAGASSQLIDSANLTFDGTYLTANSIKDTALTSGRVTYAGANGLLQDNSGLTFDGSYLTAPLIHASNNGNGTNFQVGDDAWIGDINQPNTLRITGQQDLTQGYIIFGNGDTTSLGRNGTGPLSYGGDRVILASNTTTDARSAITVVSNAAAINSTLTYTTGTGVFTFTPPLVRATVFAVDFGVSEAASAATNRAALQAFFDYVTLNGVTGIIDKGAFNIDAPLYINVMNLSFSIQGAGSIATLIVEDSTYTANTHLIQVRRSTGFVNTNWNISGFRLSKTTGNALYGIQFGEPGSTTLLEGTQGCTVSDVYVIDFPYGVDIVHSRLLRFNNCSYFCTNAALTNRIGLRIWQNSKFTGDLVFDNCQFKTLNNTGNKNIYITSTASGSYNPGVSGNYAIAGVKFLNCTTYDSKQHITIEAGNGSAVRDIWFTGCQLDNILSRGIYITSGISSAFTAAAGATGGQGSSVDDIHITDCYISGATDYQLVISGNFNPTTSITVTNTHFAQSQFSGGAGAAVLVEGNFTKNINISNNRFIDVNSTSGNVIYVTGGSHIRINNNTLGKDGFFDWYPANFINFASGVTDITCIGNDGRSIPSTALIIDNSGDIYKIIDKNLGYNPTGYKPVISPTGSPYSYKNTSGAPEAVYVSGGTISQLEVDATFTVPVATPIIMLAHGGILKITYSVAPSLYVRGI